MSGQEYKDKIRFHLKGIDNCYIKLEDHEKDWQHGVWVAKKKALIIDLSEHYKGLVEAGYPDIKLTGISSIISKECEARNIATDRWVREVLSPLGYTDTRFTNKEGGTTSASTPRNYFELDNEALDKELEKAKAIIEQVKFVKDSRGADETLHESNKISTVRPTASKKTDLYEAAKDVKEELDNFSKYWEGVVDKIEQFPIADKEQDRKCAARVRSLANMLSGFNNLLPSLKDEKFAQSFWQWCETLVQEDWYGKHAAAVKSKIPAIGTPELANKLRPLTRERIGDIKEKYWEHMKELSKALDIYAWWIGLTQWRDEYGEVSQRIADRRIREHDKLSETAFGAGYND